MSLQVNPLEAKLLKILLEQLLDEQCNAGCNDFIIPQGVFSEDELKILNEDICSLYSAGEYDNISQELKAGSCVSDSDLTSVIKKKVDKYLSSI